MFVPSLVTCDGRAPPPAAADGSVQAWREQGQICAYGYSAGGEDWMHVPELATFRLGREVVAFPSAHVDPALVRDAFERSVLPMALHLLGGEVLHASGVVGSRGVVAFCGDSGAGKSTIAQALGLRSHPVWADDAVAFEFVGERVMAVALPFRLKVRMESAEALGDGEIAWADPAVQPLTAVVILRRHPRPLAVRHLPGGQALQAVLAQAYSYRPDDAHRTEMMVANYLELVSRIPVYDVAFESEWETFGSVVDAVEGILA